MTWHTACCLCYLQRVGQYACDVTFCHTDPLFQRGQRRYHVKSPTFLDFLVLEDGIDMLS